MLLLGKNVIWTETSGNFNQCCNMFEGSSIFNVFHFSQECQSMRIHLVEVKITIVHLGHGNVMEFYVTKSGNLGTACTHDDAHNGHGHSLVYTELCNQFIMVDLLNIINLYLYNELSKFVRILLTLYCLQS